MQAAFSRVTEAGMNFLKTIVRRARPGKRSWEKVHASAADNGIGHALDELQVFLAQ